MDGVGPTYGKNGKLDFEARMGWICVSGPGICMELQCGSNGIGPGVQTNKIIIITNTINKKKIYIYIKFSY